MVQCRLGDEGTILDGFVYFPVGQGPRLPLDGRFFRRMAGKISSYDMYATVAVLMHCYKLAQIFFGDERVSFWKNFETGAVYSKDETIAAETAYVDLVKAQRQQRAKRRRIGST